MIGFITTSEALHLMSPDADPAIGTDVADTLADKRRSPGYPTLLADIRAHGITIPIHIANVPGVAYRELLDGHHRVAAADELGLTSIPWTTVPLTTA